MREQIMQNVDIMMPKEFFEYMKEMSLNEFDVLSPAERLMLLGIDPFSFYRKKKVMNIDEDEYNDDFDEEPGSVDEEPEYDYDEEIISYIHDDDESEEYDLAELKDYPFLRAVLLYNNNRRKYFA